MQPSAPVLKNVFFFFLECFATFLFLVWILHDAEGMIDDGIRGM